MRGLLDDVRYAARTLSHARLFAVAMVLVLALGIGANTAIFGLVDAVLFRRLPAARPQELIRVFNQREGEGLGGLSFPAYTDFRDQADQLAGVAAFANDVPLNLSSGIGVPERVSGAVVSGSFFDVLGVRAAHGRLLGPADDRAGAGERVAVLSDALWQRRFGADARVIGSAIRLNGEVFTIVGVTPRGFVGATLEDVPELYVPLALANTAMPDLVELEPLVRRGFAWLSVVARLRPGVSRAQAEAQLAAIATRVQATLPPAAARVVPRVLAADVASIEPGRMERASRLSWLLFGVVALLLLIACADAAGLLLARAERRRRELAIRMAMGASRWRIVRQTLVESVGLSLLGALGGLLLAMWITDLLIGIAPADFALPLGSATPVLDGRVLSFTVAVAIVTAILFGLVPALHASDTNLVTALKGEQATVPTGGRRRLPTRSVLVVVQVALSAVLLVGAGLLARTLANTSAVHPGFAIDGALVARFDLSRQGYDLARGRSFQERLLERLESTPGVSAAALASSVPVRPGGMQNSVTIAGYEFKPGEENAVDIVVASPGYFGTMGIPLLRGRDFTAADAPPAPMPAVINQAMADRFWPGQDPIGREIGDVNAIVIGVVANAKHHSLREEPTPVISVPLSQFYMSTVSVVVRSSLPETEAKRALTAAVASLDKDLPIFGVRTLRASLGVALAQERMLAGLLAAFALLALVLSAAGLYSVVAMTTQSRRREWGIRMALGAQAGDVLRLVQRQGVTLAAAGLVGGLAIAVVATRFARALLFGVAPTDPLTYVAVATILLAVAAAAAYLPARRATRVDPMSTLRAD